ncbi:MAG TPA: M12 family metallo-peptidase, partial [Luteolibacter sp.]|nr:M12 family metallo-peptidase [Luteolibacter sp.]
MPDAETARRLSPEGWKPPAVFAGSGRPAPQPPFTRGENATRRYAAPVNRELPRGPGARTPSVLAMTPEDGRTHLLPEEIDLHTRIARRMVFDPASLDRIVDGQTSRILVPTTGDEVLTLRFHAVKTRSDRTHTLLGRVAGEEENSDAIVVWHDGIIHGQIARYGIDQHLEYRIMADGHMMVRELDPSTMTAGCGNPNGGFMGDETPEGLIDEGIDIIPRSEGEIVEDTPGWRTIDVVVGYDEGARVADGGYAQIEGRIIASVDRMTQAFANSLIVNTELMLLGTIEDPYYVFPGATSGSMSDELGSLNNFSNGVLDAVSDFHTRLGSDLVCFVTRQADGSAGIAYRPGRSSIVARTYMTGNRITFAHELGHNLGCDHSWGDSSQNNTSSHYGWRIDPDGNSATTSDRVRTIMAYDWNWGSGTRIPYFANPSVSFNGAATGAVNGYNVLGDLTADQRYYQGGLGYSNSDPNKYGFDGNSPSLGARNANTINTGGPSNYGATYASNRATRTAFAVASPLAGAEWLLGEPRSILFTGGDMKDSATIELHKGGVLQTTLANNLNPATDRDFTWNIPDGLVPGSDYMIRVVLNRNGATLIADSGFFSIVAAAPSVIAHS